MSIGVGGRFAYNWQCDGLLIVVAIGELPTEWQNDVGLEGTYVTSLCGVFNGWN